MLFFYSGSIFKKRNFKIGKKCKNLSIVEFSFDKFNLKDCRDLNITVCNNGSENSIAVAEHTMLLIMALCKKLVKFNQIAKSGIWKGNSHGIDLFELNKKNWYFWIWKYRKKVAQMCSGFNMDIFYYDIKKCQCVN